VGEECSRLDGPRSLAPNVPHEFGAVAYTPALADGCSLLDVLGLGRVVYQNGTSTKPFVVLASSWFDTWYPSDGTWGSVP
jgi:hypothetical protein